MFVTIKFPSTPRGKYQGDRRIYLSSGLSRAVGDSFVIRTSHDGVFIREATLSDRDARSAKSQTSFKSQVDLVEGRHKVIKVGERYFLKP